MDLMASKDLCDRLTRFIGHPRSLTLDALRRICDNHKVGSQRGRKPWVAERPVISAVLIGAGWGLATAVGMTVLFHAAFVPYLITFGALGIALFGSLQVRAKRREVR